MRRWPRAHYVCCPRPMPPRPPAVSWACRRSRRRRAGSIRRPNGDADQSLRLEACSCSPTVPASLAGQPPFTLARVFTAWELDPVLTVLTVWVAGLYLFGVWRLHERGDHWPLPRTLSFLVPGMGLLFFATSSGLGSYDTTLLSVHMVQHMLLSMVVPLFLALGRARSRLMLRTLPPRPRRLLLSLLHSRVAAVLTFPPLTFLLFVLSPWVALLHLLVRRVAAVAVRPRDDAPAPGRRRVPVLLAAGRRRPGAGPGGLPVPAAAAGADAAVPRLPRASRSWARRP